MKVTAITASCGRHKCLERCLSFFLNQDYLDKHLVIYQNSNVYQKLDQQYSNVSLINQHIDSETKEPYTNLGAIYNDAIKYVPEDTDLIIFCDDDDIFLPNHISEGVAGFIRGNKKAYKPSVAYYRDNRGIHKVEGATMEPSIFVSFNHIKECGFSLTTTAQHLQWVNPLVYNGEIFTDKEGKPTMIYNWGDTFPTFKTSGDYGNPKNFQNYRNFSQDHGDRVITPHDVSFYYNLV